MGTKLTVKQILAERKALTKQAELDFPNLWEEANMEDNACMTDWQGPDGYLCTRQDGHEGDHVAVGLDEVLERWPLRG